MNSPANTYARAAIAARFIAPTKNKPARVKVKTQRSTRFYSVHTLPSNPDLCHEAVARYLTEIREEDRKEYGPDAKGWGELSEFTYGFLPDQTRVYVINPR